MARDLVEGLYEHIVSEGLAQDLTSSSLRRGVRPLEVGEAPLTLARHLGREIERALAALSGANRTAAQVELANALLARLFELAPEVENPEQRVAPPARLLESVYREAPPARPQTPLAASTLLTRGPSEPALGHELAREVASADRIDAVVASDSGRVASSGKDAVLPKAIRAGAWVRNSHVTGSAERLTETNEGSSFVLERRERSVP